MTDNAGKSVKIGDYVRYYHRRDNGIEKIDIGQIDSFENDVLARIKFIRRNGDNDFVLRTKSGITKLSDSEAMLYVFESR